MWAVCVVLTGLDESPEWSVWVEYTLTFEVETFHDLVFYAGLESRVCCFHNFILGHVLGEVPLPAAPSPDVSFDRARGLVLTLNEEPPIDRVLAIALYSEGYRNS